MRRRLLFRLKVSIVVSFLFAGCTAYMAGNWKLEQKNYEAAINHYREDLSKNPGHWQARERLGFAYLKTGRQDEAIQELTRALEQKPGDPYAVYYLGLAWLNKEDRAKAIDVWRTYKNREEPLVEEQIRRHVTLLEIAESQRLAKQALTEEKKLQTLPPKPGTVAVFYFEDISPGGSLRYLQKALAAMVITDLSSVKSLSVLERLRVQSLLAEMQLGQTGIVDAKTAPRVGRLLGAESLVVGTIGPRAVGVGTSVARTSPKAVVGGFSLTAAQEKFFQLEKEIVFNIVKLLPISLTPEEEELVRKYHTKNFKAVIYFGRGLEALDEGNWKEAKNFFQKALREDPEFLLARLSSEACPAGTAPGIAGLGSMTGSQLAGLVDNAVNTAMADQAAAAQAMIAADPGGGKGGSEAEAAGTGGISIGW